MISFCSLSNETKGSLTLKTRTPDGKKYILTFGAKGTKEESQCISKSIYEKLEKEIKWHIRSNKIRMTISPELRQIMTSKKSTVPNGAPVISSEGVQLNGSSIEEDLKKKEINLPPPAVETTPVLNSEPSSTGSLDSGTLDTKPATKIEVEVPENIIDPKAVEAKNLAILKEEYKALTGKVFTGRGLVTSTRVKTAIEAFKKEQEATLTSDSGVSLSDPKF